MGHVLVVDDDPDILSALVMTLQTEGHAVHAARHGQEALEALEGGLRPDVVVLDLMMPVMNGFELLDVLRRDPRWSNLPVVVLSANRGYSHDDLGVARMLRKPFDLEELFSAISAATAA
jgi:two-component system response regulator MprA